MSVQRSTDIEVGVVVAMNCCKKRNKMGVYFEVNRYQVILTRGKGHE
jgi:hypothetical protein